MRKRTLIPIAMMMCTALVVTSDALTSETIKPVNGVNQIVYTTAKTMSGTAVTAEADTDTEEEPYFSKQWALYNDGTFTLNTSGGTNFNNGGFYNDGGFNMGDPKQNPGRPGNNSGRNNFMNHFSLAGVLSLDTGNNYSSQYYNTTAAKTVEAVEDIDVDAKEAWDKVGGDGREVIVAVIDTGVDYTHEDLKDVIWTNEEEVAGDGIDNDGNGYIDDVYGWDFYNNTAYVYNSKNPSEYEHGTHCAGTIAAEINDTGIAGIASTGNVKIMSIKALGGKDGSGETSSIVKAIAYAEKMGADICNLSFGTSSYDEDLAQAIEDSDMLFVCAAGNGDNSGVGINTDETPLYPASFDYDNIISVANLVFDGNLETSSNYGEESVDIAAPGTYILSTAPANNYEYLSGTSMSAPMVTAVAALTYSYFDDISVSDTKDIVLTTAEPLDSLDGKVGTGGMVNAYNAVTADIDEILE